MDSAVLGYSPTIPARSGTRLLLSIMMFLEFFVWGSWYVTCGNFMAAHGMEDRIYLAYMVGPLAAIVSPFFLGIIADRYFSSERVLCVLQLIGGLAMFGAAIEGARGNQGPFLLLLLLHMLAYMPTLSVTNTIALSKLTNAEKQFPLIRVFGTLGWIVANLVVSKLLKADELVMQFYITGGAAIALGLFSLILPHTPPPAKGQPFSARAILGLDSLSLMKSRSFAIFIISSILICIPLQFYYVYAPVFAKVVGFAAPGAVMSFGQMSEVFFMLVMPLFFAALGVRYMLLAGMLAWVIRYGLFAAAAPTNIHSLVIAGILLHGICYDFFFVTGYIYVDRKASPEIRGQAQGFVVLVTLGLGMLIGGKLSGLLYNTIVKDKGQGSMLMKHWQEFWLAPCIAAGVIMVIFFFMFRDDTAIADRANLSSGG